MSEKLQSSEHKSHHVDFRTQSYNKKMEFANNLLKKSDISAKIIKIRATNCFSVAYFEFLSAAGVEEPPLR